MAEHAIATREEWRTARERLLEREQELKRLGDELAQERRQLPWVPVAQQYTFETEGGEKTLAQLFEGRSELLVYHLMFGPDWTAACPFCSWLADHFDGMLPHLNGRDVTLIGISHAPLEKLQAYKARMGWRFPYVFSFESDFNYDFGVSFPAEAQEKIAEQVLKGATESPTLVEAAKSCGTDVAGYVTTEGPGVSAFVLEKDVVHHTYFAQDVEFMVLYEQLLKRTPKGGKNVPPRRHDEYVVGPGIGEGEEGST